MTTKTTATSKTSLTTIIGFVIHVYEPAGTPSYGAFELDERAVSSTDGVAAAGREHRESRG